MSRCFPFPPPGYEKKAIKDEEALLTKEKKKEKKHKKDKKGNEKREGKERKDQERSKEKKREEDRKEKRKDKKEKDRDKEKNQNSDEEKHKAKKEKDRDKGKNQTSDEKRVKGQSESCNDEKFGPNNLQNVEARDSKYVEELARRIKGEDRATGSQMVQKISFTDTKRAELSGSVVESKIGEQPEKKEKTKDKKEDDRKANGQKNHAEGRGFDIAIVQNLSGMDQKRVGRNPESMEKKDVEKQMEGKETIKHKKIGSKPDEHKDRKREKKRKSKDKDRDKEKEKEEKADEKAKEKSKQSREQPKLKDSGKDSLNSYNIKPSASLKETSRSYADEGYLGKRKEPEMNGYLHDNGFRPNKLPRPVSSSLSVVENGRKLELYQNAIHFASERQGATNNCKVDIKENRTNGFKEVRRPNGCSTSHSTTTLQVKKNGEASARPPHPDTKYLSQILSIPKLEELPDIDDQEWLCSSNTLESKKPRVGSPGVEGTPQVWAEAFQIESADIFALPYVIPY